MADSEQKYSLLFTRIGARKSETAEVARSYADCLDWAEARRHIVEDNGLLDQKRLKSFEKKLSRDQLDVWNKNRVFLPALGRADFEKYVEAVVGPSADD